MKRTIILCSLLVAAFGLAAQPNQKSNYIGIGGGYGMQTLLYSPDKGTATLNNGFMGELRYTHFFGKHFGIGLGAQFLQSKASTLYDFAETTTGLTHSDNTNLTYDLTTRYTQWNEVQTLYHLGVPVELYWRAPIGQRWSFLLGAGARLDLPISGKYTADEGTYDNTGQFYLNGTPLSYTIADLPNHGFRAYDADFESDFKLRQLGVSVIADLGFTYAMSNHWSLYLGIYGGYSLTDMLDSVSRQPLLSINTTDASKLDYNGTLASNQIKELRLINAGVKLGIQFGWNCHAPAEEVVSTPQLTSYENNTDDEAAARTARCNARRMNDPQLKQAVANIEADLEEVNRAANEVKSRAAQDAVLDARAYTADAMQAHKSGQYCKSYDHFRNAYAAIASAYAAVASTASEANPTDLTKKAAADAALYADAAHNDGLECAMAASRNAKLTSEIARNGGEYGDASPAYNDQATASQMAEEALSMAKDAASKPATTDAKDAAGKAYRGNLAASYAASAKSFSKSAAAYAKKRGDDNSKAAASEAARYATEASEAARMENTAAAYRAALAAQKAARRAKTGESASTLTPKTAAAATVSTAQLCKYLDLLNTAIHFDFGSTEPIIAEGANSTILALCQAMKASPSVKILVTGHTDNVGTPEGNLTLGQQRATAVKQMLVKHGAPSSSIATTSKGDTEPVADNDTDDHRALNRRATIALQ
ncbi:MAG: OmpA family protein [Bacteroidales bacterium]|nr:OmpA family protein [Bacteroidales bacterium]